MQHYWFVPKRFWKVCAAYYPVTWEGWMVTLVIVGLGIALYFLVDSGLLYATLLVVLALIFDLACFRTGEYPSWWKTRQHRGR
jgi:hypothetical protein